MAGRLIISCKIYILSQAAEWCNIIDISSPKVLDLKKYLK